LTARRALCPERAGGLEINSSDYADEGKSYDEALKAALLWERPELSDRAFEAYVNKTGDAGFRREVPDDAKSLIFAKAGREDFVNPEGAPIVYTLRQPDGESRRHRRSHQHGPRA
jgi:hypothetical protein